MSKQHAALSKQHLTLLPKRHNIERVYRKILSVRQSRMLLWHCCRFWQQCRTKLHPFDKVEANWTCLICFDFVERSKFRLTLPKMATVSKQHSTMSKESFDL